MRLSCSLVGTLFVLLVLAMMVDTIKLRYCSNLISIVVALLLLDQSSQERYYRLVRDMFGLDLGASSRTTVGPSTAGEGPDFESASVFLAASNQARRSNPGLCGLRNIGNTCFMNSIVQCLSNTVVLRDYLVSKQFVRDIRSESRGDLIRSFSDLLVELWQGDQQVVNTTAFKSQVQRFAPRFMGYNQQDAQEFLRYLLEGLHQDVNQVVNKSRRSSVELSDEMPVTQKARESWKLYLLSENSKIVELFVGQLRSVLNFSGCGHQSTTFEVFWDLSLPLVVRGDSSSLVQLTQCVENFMREEILEGDEMPVCTKCNIRRKCTKRYSIQKFPKVLVLHLKRFGPNDRFRNKLSQSVDFPIMGLDLSSFSESMGNQITSYNLYAVSNHSGTPQSGHYTAICRHPFTNHWYLFNDSVVTPISPSRIPSGQAYVLFYEQTNN